MSASVTEIGARRRWMSVLAKAATNDLEALWTGVAATTGYRVLRGPEVGLVMVRGRMGGTGAPFNLGEMTVTRCAVQLDDGTIGHAYVAGRDRRHAELAAALDAVLQLPQSGPLRELVERVAAGHDGRTRAAEARAAATRVEFLTLARGED
jgi:alpha-D-ribose 1-methylphosphonate 5-triphosphate synthase subunit PhnG